MIETNSYPEDICRQPKYVRNSAPVHILHIRKAGGTAIRQALAPFAAQLGLRLHKHDVTLADIPPGEPVVLVVRDPIKRFVSGFNSRLRKGQPRNNNPWSPDEEAAFRRFATPNALAEALSGDGETRTAALHAMESITHLRHRLDYWLVSADYLSSRSQDILFICRLDQLDADFERLRSILRLPRSVALPRDDIDAHRTPPGYSSSLSDLGLLNLIRWYAGDFPLYRKCNEIRDSLLGWSPAVTGVDTVDRLLARSIHELATTTVDRPFVLERGRLPDLKDHLDRLEAEFGGRDQLSFLHAALTVLIRREVALRSSLEAFRNLWEVAGPQLCQNLDLRWLISACDTIADHPVREVDAARALLASTLANTVKLYETERRAVGEPRLTQELVDATAKDRPGLLFDGMTRFGIQGGDMIRNLLLRLQRLNADRLDPVQRLTVEIINRVLNGPTVFQRFSGFHKSDGTHWGPIEP